MRALVQRVKKASVSISDKEGSDKASANTIASHIDGHSANHNNSQIIGDITQGLLVYICMEQRDDNTSYQWMIRKLNNIRLFDDDKGFFNYSVQDIGGSLLIIPNFTLLGNARKGSRPNFSTGIQREEAHEKFDAFIQLLMSESQKNTLHTPYIETGRFGASMEIEALIDGPVNLIIDSPNRIQ